jgi:hypothetical protein
LSIELISVVYISRMKMVVLAKNVADKKLIVTTSDISLLRQKPHTPDSIQSFNSCEVIPLPIQAESVHKSCENRQSFVVPS